MEGGLRAWTPATRMRDRDGVPGWSLAPASVDVCAVNQQAEDFCFSVPPSSDCNSAFQVFKKKKKGRKEERSSDGYFVPLLTPTPRL